MAKLNEFLTSLIKKAGLNPDDDAIKTFLSQESLSTIEVPEPVQKPIDSSLISLTDAKNNHPDIKNYYTKQALDTLDKKVDALMDQFGLSEDEKNAIKVERSSYLKPELLIKSIQKLEQAKASADKPDKAAIQRQIDDLHAQIRAKDEAVNGIKADYAKKEKDLRIGYSLQSLLGNHKTINDHLEPDVRFEITKALLDKRLRDSNAKFDFDDNGRFVLLKNDGTNFYGDSNQQVDAKQFVEQTLSNNKLLVTTKSDSGNAGGNGANSSQNGQNGSAPTNGSGKSTGASSAYKELMKNAMEGASQKSPAFGN